MIGTLKKLIYREMVLFFWDPVYQMVKEELGRLHTRLFPLIIIITVDTATP